MQEETCSGLGRGPCTVTGLLDVRIHHTWETGRGLVVHSWAAHARKWVQSWPQGQMPPPPPAVSRGTGTAETLALRYRQAGLRRPGHRA